MRFIPIPSRAGRPSRGATRAHPSDHGLHGRQCQRKARSHPGPRQICGGTHTARRAHAEVELQERVGRLPRRHRNRQSPSASVPDKQTVREQAPHDTRRWSSTCPRQRPPLHPPGQRLGRLHGVIAVAPQIHQDRMTITQSEIDVCRKPIRSVVIRVVARFHCSSPPLRPAWRSVALICTTPASIWGSRAAALRQRPRRRRPPPLPRSDRAGPQIRIFGQSHRSLPRRTFDLAASAAVVPFRRADPRGLSAIRAAGSVPSNLRGVALFQTPVQ